jgi:hypothetical protein
MRIALKLFALMALTVTLPLAAQLKQSIGPQPDACCSIGGSTCYGDTCSVRNSANLSVNC